ncbi:hydrogen gas-evolving membrane-bound hydrogenase subunit E [Mucisphaera calidilacus]|uniref:Na(+)/H(+) antiporter subunit A n=1 Tax=Mucisphaera calidilacus TaxID=2527982 RepID=A0A518BX76_9BACT|nr:hydrogen gas-evolving membrane-bound hydrogenase subunit E [Mucisphaera calidilacus]QDU71568.1 Na(+)/H(+) antiporter subunit A [Mucisphaera calidilacus]
MNNAWIILFAVLAPLVTGMLTLLLPRQAITLKVLLAALGPVVAFAFIIAGSSRINTEFSQHALDHHADHATAHLDDHHHAGHDPFADIPLPTSEVIPWMPALNLSLAFNADGLSVFFALLVSGIGLMIVLYARGYFGPNADDLGRFYPTLGFFMTAMLGIVVSDYTLQMLLFWEMTSISSFLLIGWDRYDKKAVKLAMQAFFTTGLGGMALFGGLLLLGVASGNQGLLDGNGIWRWSELYANVTQLDLNDPWVVSAFLLMFIGAATKSAQWPFHYWLPGAMAAPTPVSAFLHSATMVKAGVFLAGRILPTLGTIDAFPWLLVGLGGVTMLLGGLIAIQQHDLKRIFAYTTVSQLGLLMAMYGLGSLRYAHGDHTLPAIDLDLTQIANHAFYKAPLFIAAGAIGHLLSRDITRLTGAFYKFPAIGAVLILAGYGLAAGPGTVSFQAKELFLYAIYHATSISPWFWILMAMTVVTAICNVAIFIRLTATLLDLPGGMGPYAEAHADDHHHAHEPERGFWGAMIWIPGFLLVVPQYVGGLFPSLWNQVFMPGERFAYYDSFSHGVPSVYYLITHPGWPLFCSMLALGLGIVVGFLPAFRRAIVDIHDTIYPAVYWLAVSGGGILFRIVQTGRLRQYTLIVLLTLTAMFTAAVITDGAMIAATTSTLAAYTNWYDHLPGIMLGLLVCASAVCIPATESRVVRVLLLGACGFSVVGIYLVYRAPDLALTQLMFEVISVLLFVVVLRLLPEDKPRPYRGKPIRIVISILIGLIMGWMTLIAATAERPIADDQTLGSVFVRNSAYGDPASPLATERGGGGTNVVNVILVDFRGWDTFGEITVLAIAAIGVWSILPSRRKAVTS